MIPRTDWPPKIQAVMASASPEILESYLSHHRESDEYFAASQADAARMAEIRRQRDAENGSYARVERDHLKIGVAIPAKLEKEHEARLAEFRKELRKTQQHKSEIAVNRIDGELKKLPPNSQLVPHDPIDVPKGATEQDFNTAISDMRNLEAEIESVWNAPPPAKEVIAALESNVDAIAKAPGIRGFAAGFGMSVRGERNPRLTYPPRLDLPTTLSPNFGFSESIPVVDVIGLMAWACGDMVKAKLGEAVKAHYADVERTTKREDKGAMIAKLDADLLRAQRTVEALYRQCRKNKIQVMRPKGLPWHVLLTCEPTPQIIAKSKPTPKPAPAVDDDADDMAWLEPDGAENAA